MKSRTAYGTLPYNRRYLLTHPWEILRWLWDETCWFVQRGLYGYAECDWWSIPDYVLTWLPNALRDMAENAYGYPTNVATFEDWQAELRQIADGLETGRQFLDHEEIEAPPEFDEAMEHFQARFWHLWD